MDSQWIQKVTVKNNVRWLLYFLSASFNYKKSNEGMLMQSDKGIIVHLCGTRLDQK